MKKTTFTLLLSFSCYWLAAQCPTGDITFSTQGQIDSFQINYPGCTDMPGSVHIAGSDITNLQGLSMLDSIGGCLKIYDNPQLTSLNGLENLSSVGVCSEGSLIKYSFGLLIQNNAVLTSLAGLDHLQSVKACVTVEGNPSLTSLSSLDSLASVGICVRSGIDIYKPLHSVGIIGNNRLKTINAFENLDSLQILKISWNDSLPSLEGLESLHTVSDRLHIEGNYSLQSLQGLNNIRSVAQLYIGYTYLLQNFKGLDSLQSAGKLYIEANAGLQNFAGLEKLENLDCYPYYFLDESIISLHVESNYSLIDFSGLENLQNIGCDSAASVTIINNWSLQSLSGIELKIDTSIGVIIQENPSLSICAIQPVCTHLENGRPATISNNAPGCNSVAEVEAACVVSIEETEGGPILISPNPAYDFLQIQISDHEKWDVSLFDLQGRQLLRQHVSGSQLIDLKDWPSSIYALRAVSGGRVFSGKIVKQ